MRGLKGTANPFLTSKRPWKSLDRSCIFSSFDFKSGFWQVDMDKASKQYTAFTVGVVGFLQVQAHAFWAM